MRIRREGGSGHGGGESKRRRSCGGWEGGKGLTGWKGEIPRVPSSSVIDGIGQLSRTSGRTKDCYKAHTGTATPLSYVGLELFLLLSSFM